MEFRDYYQVLDVAKDASADAIKKAYRKLARRYHPDVNPGDASAEKRFKELNEAHAVLSNPETRRKYDVLGANWKQYDGMPPGTDPFGAGGPFAGFGGSGVRWTVHPGDAAGDQPPFSDFFEAFFGRGDARRPRAPRRRARGRDLERTLEISLGQVLSGVTRRLPAIADDVRRPAVDVRVPAGIADGARIRVAGRGGRGTTPGDLYLRIRIAPHPVFERRGEHLYVRAAVPIPTAVLGGEVEVPTLDGPAVRLRIPPLTPPGRMLRIKGKGLPTGTSGAVRGHLHATVHVTLPASLTPAQRAHYEALAALETQRPDTADGRAREETP